MQNAVVESVWLDSMGNLRVKAKSPVHPNYAFIYRAASSVRWDEETASLFVLPSLGLSAVEAFRLIASAIYREYGENLFINESTRFAGLDPAIVTELHK